MNHFAIVFGIALLLAGCDLSGEALLPSLTGEDPGGGEPVHVATTQAEPGPGGLPTFGTTKFEPPGITSGTPSGTIVGQKTDDLRADLGRLQNRLSEHNEQLQADRGAARESVGAYHDLVGAMHFRLQSGTTPNNPDLMSQWNQAQGELDELGESIADLNTLSNESASTSALAAFLLESARATYELDGAVAEDHRQLAVLEDEVSRTVVLVDQMLDELTADIALAETYFTAESASLTAMQVAIETGEYDGRSLAGLADGTPAPGAATLVGQRPPLVVIRFNQPDVDYEQALIDAVSRTLERRPNAAFDLVAVAPSGGSAAQVSLAAGTSRRNAEGVLRALTDMGLPAERITLSETSSPSAEVDEVHVYVR